MTENHFPHVEFIKLATGGARLRGFPNPDLRVTENKNNRAQHSADLKGKIGSLSVQAQRLNQERQEQNLPQITGGVPFMLQIPDEDGIVMDFVAKKLNLEIVAEYDDGYLIVSTKDLELRHVLDLANGFAINEHGSGQMAKILDIETDRASTNRIRRILGEELYEQWHFPNSQIMVLDVSIESASFNPPAKPTIRTNTPPELKEERIAEHKEAVKQFAQQWDEERMNRETEIENFVSHYEGEILHITDGSGVDFSDSFSVRVKMRGEGFVDLVTNFPSLFEVAIPDDVDNPLGEEITEDGDDDDFNLIEPHQDSPCICVIDSGMQENHRWLAGAIDTGRSRCFIPDEQVADVADYVDGGGHGTRVAGTCLFHDNVPKEGEYQSPFWLQNARILDENNQLVEKLFPAEALNEIVDYYLSETETRIFQHSIASNRECRLSRMSIWACAIDQISHNRNVLFIQCAGNLADRGLVNAPGIIDHLNIGRQYPDYLYEASSRSANPAQSLQALTVGSISADFFQGAYVKSLAPTKNPSAFSRSGFGLWNSIKPEVVEIGGDYARDTGSPPALTTPSEVCPEMIRSTLNGGPAYASDSVGTSFSAPKISHIAGHIAAMFPAGSPLLYRALIVNSARWPEWAETAPVGNRPKIVRSLGYGVPNLERATENSENRITLITEGVYEPHSGDGYVFGIPIPESLRRPGEDYEVRIDVTLSYSAEPRRTRKSRRGYLGVWLDWVASKKEESFETFRARVLKDFEQDDANDTNFKWTFGKKMSRDGQTEGVTRQNGTLQKDWTYARSHELPEVLGVAVHAHQGWCSDGEETAKFTLVASIEILGEGVQVYEEIREAVRQQAEVETETILGDLL